MKVTSTANLCQDTNRRQVSAALLELACTLDNVSTEMKSGLLVLVLCATLNLTQAGHRRLDTTRHVSPPHTRRRHVSKLGTWRRHVSSLGTCVTVLSVGAGGEEVRVTLASCGTRQSRQSFLGDTDTPVIKYSQDSEVYTRYIYTLYLVSNVATRRVPG